MHFCDPNQLIATKQRNKLAAANKALCYLTRGSFKEDQHTQASVTCVCLSLRLFVRTVWLEDCAQEEQRESEEEDAEAAIAEHEKDRSGLEGAVTVAQCPPLCVAVFRGTQSCAVRASGGGADSPGSLPWDLSAQSGGASNLPSPWERPGFGSTDILLFSRR